MKVRLLKLKSWLLMTLMGSLGLGACHSAKQAASPEPERPQPVRGRDEIRLMYGVPTMDFHVKGRVIDAKGKPVRDAKVTMLERGMEVQADTLVGDAERVQAFLDGKAVRTDNKGRFEVRESGTPQESVRLFVREKDEPKAGHVAVIEVDAASVDRTAASGWNTGTFSKEVEIPIGK